MDLSNPYESPPMEVPPARTVRQSFRAPRLLAGFCGGAAIPAVMGVYGLCEFRLRVAALPAGQVVCGNEALDSIMLIVLVAPLLGLIGAAIVAAVR